MQQDSSLYPITFLPPVGDTHMFSTQFINSTTLRFKLREHDSTITNYDLTINDTTTNWNNLIITQITGSTHFYVNGTHQHKAAGKQVGLWGNVIKGYNAQARTSNDYHLDEECLYNVGLSGSSVSMIYNNAEYFNPNKSTLVDNLVGWWTYGDHPLDLREDEIPKDTSGGAGGHQVDALRNQAVTSSAADHHQSFYRYTTNEFVRHIQGPFTTQNKGNIKISPVRNLIGGINFGDSDGDGAVDNQFNIPFTAERSNNSFTLAFWFKPQAGISGTSRFLAGTGLPGNPIRYVPQGSGVVRFKLNAFGVVVNKDVDIADDEWHHFALVIDKDSDFLSLYVNGQLEISGNITTYYDIINWAIPIATSSDVQNYAEYIIFGSALNVNQIGDLYNGGYPRDPTGLSFASSLENWYRFSEKLSPPDTTTTIRDRVGNNDATVGPSGDPNYVTFIAGPKSSVEHNSYYHELQGYNSSISLPIKAKEIYIKADKSQTTFEIIAELTNIPTDNMYKLAGSGIDE